MIVGYISDPTLRAALVAAAHWEEDAILTPELADEAVSFGYPRMVVTTPTDDGEAAVRIAEREIPLLLLTPATLERWEVQRREMELPPPRVAFMAQCLRGLMEWEAHEVSWVDRALGDLGRAAGAPLPPALRTFARRVMEFPSHYDDLHPLASACGTTHGALKARFRRRDLSSPSLYLRWFRTMAVAQTLSDRTLTVAQAASHLGYTSDGNLCRTMRSLTGLTPTEVRTLHGWNRLLITFAWTHLSKDALERWRGLDDLFEVARVA